jgi:formate dehydrogenase maturation protein FdhE
MPKYHQNCHHLARRVDGFCRVCKQNRIAEFDQAARDRYAANERYFARQEADRLEALAKREAMQDALDVAADLDAARKVAEYNHELIDPQIAEAFDQTDPDILADLDALNNKIMLMHTEVQAYERALAEHLADHRTDLREQQIREHTKLAEARLAADYCSRGHELVPENVIELAGSDPEHPQRICKSCRETYYAQHQTTKGA